MPDFKIKKDEIDYVRNFLSSISGFVEDKRDGGSKKNAHSYSDGLIVNLYDNGTLTFQGKNVDDGEIVKSVKKFIQPYLELQEKNTDEKTTTST